MVKDEEAGAEALLRVVDNRANHVNTLVLLRTVLDVLAAVSAALVAMDLISATGWAIAVAVVVVTLSGAATSLTALCAWIYLAARVLYIPAYAFGWTPWRSIIFGVGFLATFVMILAALI